MTRRHGAVRAPARSPWSSRRQRSSRLPALRLPSPASRSACSRCVDGTARCPQPGMAESPRFMSWSPALVSCLALLSAGAAIVGAQAAESGPTMELLGDFDPSDQVSQLLRVIRIRSSIYCRSLMGAPWGFGVEARGNPAFHVVTAGGCWLEVDGEPGQIPLAAGDLALLPRGSRHWLRDEPATAATVLEEILAETPLDRHRRLRYGGSGPQTALLCGGFAVDGGPAHPVLRAFPPAVVIRGASGRPEPWLAATLELLNAEATADAPGAGEVVTRLADVLLTQALRAAVNQLGSSNGPGLLALRDRQIASAIQLIHSQPGHGWTVGELAARSEEHTSNSSHEWSSYAVFCLKKKRAWPYVSGTQNKQTGRRESGMYKAGS